MLTNREMLNLPEFRFTPFRPRLIYALQLKSDKQVEEMRNLQNEEVRLEDLGQLGPSDKKDKDEQRPKSQARGDGADEEAGDDSDAEKKKKEKEQNEDEAAGDDDLVDDPRFIE